MATYPLPGMDLGAYAVTGVTCTLALLVVGAYACLSAMELARAKAERRKAGRRRLSRFAVEGLAIAGVNLLLWQGGRLLLSSVLGMLGQQELAGAYHVFCTDFLVLLCVSLSVLATAAAWRIARSPALHDWPYPGAR